MMGERRRGRKEVGLRLWIVGGVMIWGMRQGVQSAVDCFGMSTEGAKRGAREGRVVVGQMMTTTASTTMTPT